MKDSIKIYCLLIGAGSTGKSTLMARLGQSGGPNRRSPSTEYDATTRIQIQRKSYAAPGTNNVSGNRRVDIVYLEFPGLPIYQGLVEEFVSKQITPTGTPYIIVAMFDVSKQSSLTYLEEVINSIGGSAKPSGKSETTGSGATVPKLMVGNKIDLVDKRIVTGQEANAKASMLKCRLIECSLRNDLSVTDLEDAIVQETAKWIVSDSTTSS